MQTLIFVDTRPFQCGFQLSRQNLHYAPLGRIRIARFTLSFNPSAGRGYYGDIYLRRFIRKWKNEIIRKRERKLTKLCIIKKNILNDDVLCTILEFI
jgi:hypothetical protein